MRELLQAVELVLPKTLVEKAERLAEQEQCGVDRVVERALRMYLRQMRARDGLLA